MKIRLGFLWQPMGWPLRARSKGQLPSTPQGAAVSGGRTGRVPRRGVVQNEFRENVMACAVSCRRQSSGRSRAEPEQRLNFKPWKQSALLNNLRQVGRGHQVPGCFGFGLEDILNCIMRPLLHVNAIKRRDYKKHQRQRKGGLEAYFLPLPSGSGELSAALSKGNRRSRAFTA